MRQRLTGEERIEKIQGLNLTSDIFAGKVLEEPEVLEEFLHLLTGRDWHICEVKSQYSIRQISGHSVVLDLFAADKNGTRIHLELQNREDDEHILRTRYCRACIDTTLLDKGLKYGELSELWQIFITQKDFLQCGRPLVWNKKCYSDGTTEIYFNLSSKDGRNKGQEKLQDYMRHTVSENESALFPKLVDRVHFLKKEKKGLGQMCEIFDKVRQDGIEYGRQEGRREGRKEGRLEGIIMSIDKLIDSFNITKERACEMMGIDLSEYERVQSGLLLTRSENEVPFL